MLTVGLFACYDPSIRPPATADAGTDAPMAPNDDPANAILLSGVSGSAALNIAGIDDDSGETDCALAGRRDVYFEIEATDAEVVYFDTSRSTLPTTLEIRTGACTAGTWLACGNQCGDSSQLAVQLEAATFCVIVEVPATGTGEVLLDYFRSDWRGSGPTLIDGDIRNGSTCGPSDDVQPQPSCQGAGSGGGDEEYALLLCPGRWRVGATTCATPSGAGDNVLYLRRDSPLGDELACDDDTCPNLQATISADVDGPGLFWMIVDSYASGSCGDFRLEVGLEEL